MRGEGSRCRIVLPRDRGSPPRAWGRLDPRRPGDFEIRFTPTCVGKAAQAGRCPGRPPVHPHVRGEGNRGGMALERMTGSPPRAWGRLTPAGAAVISGRFTPTCVGKARGEFICRQLNIGSPPRAWGRRRPEVSQACHARFTPTCVGKADVLMVPELEYIGSPPRAWGRRDAHRLQTRRQRFTPTCVGKAVASVGHGASLSVHPHVRGEGSSSFAFCVRNFGSPPRAWGRLPFDVWPIGRRRFTPTCVGKAHSPARLRPALTVHPHVRGEGGKRLGHHHAHAGSPPRAWGRRRECITRAALFGSPPRAWGRRFAVLPSSRRR